MELTVTERVLLLNVLPTTGSLVTMRIRQTLLTDLGFSESEIKENNIVEHKTDDGAEGNTTWENTGYVKEIELGANAHVLVVETLNAMDKAKTLTEHHLSLCDKFAIGVD